MKHLNSILSLSFVYLSALAGLVLTGCTSLPKAQFAAAKSEQVYLARTTPQDLEVYRSQLPARPYYEIGSVSACCIDNSEKLVQLLRSEAAENGGDAIIGLDIEPQGSAMASVVRYKDNEKSR